MRTPINQPVKILLDIDSAHQKINLHRIKWGNRVYSILETGIQYSVRDGRKMVHVFQVNVGVLDMRLHIDADTLHATLIETSDGLAD